MSVDVYVVLEDKRQVSYALFNYTNVIGMFYSENDAVEFVEARGYQSTDGFVYYPDTEQWEWHSEPVDIDEDRWKYARVIGMKVQ